MKNNSNLLFSYYSGNIYKSESLGNASLNNLIDAIQNPKPKFKKLFNSIKKATAANNISLKRELKQLLFSFTPCVTIKKGSKRSYANVLQFTGLMQIDLDGIETTEKAEHIKKHIFENNKEIVCAFLSPSRKGVKCLMRIDKPKDLEHYKALHKAMESSFEEYSYLDAATKNAVLPMFLSYDENILYRDFSSCLEWSLTDYTEPKYISLNTKPTTSQHATNASYNYKKVVRIITERFNNILDNGHPQVVSTSLVLGSRVSAGYISKDEAERLAHGLITQNQYLSKNIKGYLSSSYWAIKEGCKSPRYF